MLLTNVFPLFVAEYENHYTRESYCVDLKQLIEMYGHRPVAEIISSDLLQWRGILHERGLAQRTINNRVKKAKHFFSWCCDNGLIAVSPASGLTVRVIRRTVGDKAAPDWLLLGMMEIAQSQENPLKAGRDAALVGMLIEYGARRSDALSARLSRLTSTHFVLTVKGGHESRKRITRGYRPILENYLAMRRTLPVEHDYLFVSVYRPHQPIKPDTVNKIVEDLSVEAGRRITTHQPRHRLGQRHADRHDPPTITQSLLDHANVKTTLEYYYNQDQGRVDATLEDGSILKPKSGRVIKFPKSDADTDEKLG